MERTEQSNNSSYTISHFLSFLNFFEQVSLDKKIQKERIGRRVLTIKLSALSDGCLNFLGGGRAAERPSGRAAERVAS